MRVFGNLVAEYACLVAETSLWGMIVELHLYIIGI